MPPSGHADEMGQAETDLLRPLCSNAPTIAAQARTRVAPTTAPFVRHLGVTASSRSSALGPAEVPVGRATE